MSGNPSGRPRGIVEFIKGETNDYEDLLSFMVKVAKGQDIPGYKPTLKERMDCINSLLNRSVGKPTQVLVETGEDTSKEVLATMQALLKKGTKASNDGEPTKMPENVSAIDQMRFKLPKNT